MNWAYIIIGGAAAEIALLTLVYHLTAKRSEGAIKALEAHNNWLREQLDHAKDNTPDLVAERLKKRVEQQKEELERLSRDYEANQLLIQQKEVDLNRTKAEITELTEQMDHAVEVLENLEYYKEQFGCPVCSAELTTLAGEDVEVRVYACGNTNGPSYSHPCPYDPNFPKFEDYELTTRQNAPDIWWCSPKPKTKMAGMLTLDSKRGRTEEEAKENVKKDYQFKARDVPKLPTDHVV